MLYLQLDVKYMLIVRTKGGMFEKLPIIPLFNVSSHEMKGNIISYWIIGSCISRVYRHRLSVWSTFTRLYMAIG